MQYWLDRSAKQTRLTAVTSEAVYAADLDHAAAERLASALAAGGSPAALFDAGADHVALRTLEKVTCSSTDDDIDFTYQEGGKSKTESITFADTGTRAAAYAEIARVMAGRLKPYEDVYTPARAAVGGLTWFTGFALGTALFALMAATLRTLGDVEIGGRRRAAKQAFVWVLDTLGPAGVSAVGAVLCLACLWYAWTRFAAPPRLLVLQKTPYVPAGAFGVGLRYALIALVWAGVGFVFLR